MRCKHCSVYRRRLHRDTAICLNYNYSDKFQLHTRITLTFNQINNIAVGNLFMRTYTVYYYFKFEIFVTLNRKTANEIFVFKHIWRKTLVCCNSVWHRNNHSELLAETNQANIKPTFVSWMQPSKCQKCEN